MKVAGQIRLLALSAVIACTGGVAEARSSHGNGTSSHGNRGAGHGTSISYSTAHGRNLVSHIAFGRFGRFHGGSRIATGYSHGSGLQCVTFARADSGIELTGNASAWWYNAEGVYQRGNRPEPGAVLNFRANGRMRLGHVAVVNRVVDGRTIEIDHANWGGSRGQVTRDISVVDVSPDNDWSAVRVELGHTGDYGSIYPTYGFIYNRPDTGRLVQASAEPGPAPILNAAPSDLRPGGYDEVADAPDSAEPIGGLRHAHRGSRDGHHLVAGKRGRSGRSLIVLTGAHHPASAAHRAKHHRT